MGLRGILMRLVLNERVINRLADTKPIRLLARLCASLYMEGRAITQDPALKAASPEKAKEALKKFSTEFGKTIKEAKEEFKKGVR